MHTLSFDCVKHHKKIITDLQRVHTYLEILLMHLEISDASHNIYEYKGLQFAAQIDLSVTLICNDTMLKFMHKFIGTSG